MKNQPYIATLILVIWLCSSSAQSDESEQQKLAERIDAINLLINQASHLSSLWRETKYLSIAAKNYAASGDYTLANETLDKAEHQAKLGIQQAQNQSDINKLIPSYLQH